MDKNDQNQTQAGAVAKFPYSAPPPAGYPTKEGEALPVSSGAVETQARGDGFWKGCCAALCCCCVLDACF
ncbi:protein CYSTEINE-RICH TRANSMEMBRANE MODULE 9 isoform X2 [Daucus carota subsp. sativus]|uniref:protein CYSTEINE-RICH TRANSMEMBRANE MODULE 9 isoform X2 n=1 Tax=Daucus carota subsp. sativus TaxID=79200 RepID=UPI0007B2BD8A|nr:PREDICTED: cysteine-rich and transmembrane domain-containing protein A-like isoform X2 [Daucus carota subsp. sativus]